MAFIPLLIAARPRNAGEPGMNITASSAKAAYIPIVSPFPMAAAIWLSAASICRRTASLSGAAGAETVAQVVSAAGGSFVGVHAASSTIGTAAIARRRRDMARLL